VTRLLDRYVFRELTAPFLLGVGLFTFFLTIDRIYQVGELVDPVDEEEEGEDSDADGERRAEILPDMAVDDWHHVALIVRWAHAGGMVVGGAARGSGRAERGGRGGARRSPRACG
jgi:hypothetical protein